jgi:hypothetical protein
MIIRDEALNRDFILKTAQSFSLAANTLEQSIQALLLLEALTLGGIPFLFKGGTSLLLILKTPERISTDIDIVVFDKEDVRKIIKQLKKLSPFKQITDITKKNNPIPVFQFRLPFSSVIQPLNPAATRLDILVEKNNYSMKSVPIRTIFLPQSGEPRQVLVPKKESLLADKLTAFAPNTIGIHPLVKGQKHLIDKKLEVMKQLFDVSCLFSECTDFALVEQTYHAIATSEIAYRNDPTLSIKDCLLDSYHSALVLASEGLEDPSHSYEAYFKSGIISLKNHVFGGRFGQIEAAKRASKVLLLCAGLLSQTNIFKPLPPLAKGFASECPKFMQKWKGISRETYDRLLQSHFLERFFF